MGLGTGHALCSLELEAEALAHKACRTVAILTVLEVLSYFCLLASLVGSALPQATVIGVHTAATRVAADFSWSISLFCNDFRWVLRGGFVSFSFFMSVWPPESVLGRSLKRDSRGKVGTNLFIKSRDFIKRHQDVMMML